ncbi:hypothetical protein OWR29_37580 [Actinoplanes sp. Pm04-4]|uniref:Uncharacterized protein n=1 Tax=Paractinoplanes pyxinae TaxID=2997416 RepID=A0ABT4BDS6_9ACTN|nr:hypothetical protein [Actinoplanes pyxinae]MCY1143745.1 hypothetical protein [Actinoplanes pyxinae]
MTVAVNRAVGEFLGVAVELLAHGGQGLAGEVVQASVACRAVTSAESASEEVSRTKLDQMKLLV